MHSDGDSTTRNNEDSITNSIFNSLIQKLCSEEKGKKENNTVNFRPMKMNTVTDSELRLVVVLVL